MHTADYAFSIARRPAPNTSTTVMIPIMVSMIVAASWALHTDSDSPPPTYCGANNCLSCADKPSQAAV